MNNIKMDNRYKTVVPLKVVTSNTD